MIWAYGIVNGTKCSLTDTDYFNDGTPNIRMTFDEKVDRCENAVFEVSFKESEWAQELFWMHCVADELRGRVPMILKMPYIPNARMDRRLPCRAFTLKTFADIINSMGFDEVVVFDPHSDVAPALIDRCRVEMPDFRPLTDLVKDPVMVFPDAGAMHRYRNYVPEGIPLTFGEKVRDIETNYVVGYELFKGEELRGKDIVIADDIISHGYTMVFLLEALMKFEPRSVMIYASHIEDSCGWGRLYEELKNNEAYKGIRLFSTDSIIRGDWVEDHVPLENSSDKILELIL